MSTSLPHPAPVRIGWREFIGLHDLGIASVKAKIDTGARTTALHAEDIRVFRGVVSKKPKRVEFTVPIPSAARIRHVRCSSAVVDRRKVVDSGGHAELRYVIRTTITLGKRSWPAEVTLTNRSGMRFPMLLGRTALRGRFLVDTAHSFLVGKNPHRKSRPKRPGRP